MDSKPIQELIESDESEVIPYWLDLQTSLLTWEPEHRRAAEGHGLRYPTDLSDARWPLLNR